MSKQDDVGAADPRVIRLAIPSGLRKLPRQARSLKLVGTLKRAAREILEQDGRAALSVTALAQRAGIAPSSIYKYFPTMDDLIAAIFDDHRAEYRQRLLDSIAALPPESTLHDGLVLVLETGIELLRKWSCIDPVFNVKAAHYDELVRLNLIKPDAFWTLEITPALLARFAHEICVQDPKKAQFLVFQTLMALPRAMVLERPASLADPQTPYRVARMLCALLTGAAQDGELR
ncbi:TetR/AcrR family transcriptional regulator [Paraburkholderia caffeinilytica]|uniref:TetR/AcrR family transcriptional regulator n=1 Tax=Paraburkholderia caffeinilytica TaxID=1761016 RepID=UPI0038B7C3F8